MTLSVGNNIIWIYTWGYILRIEDKNIYKLYQSHLLYDNCVITTPTMFNESNEITHSGGTLMEKNLGYEIFKIEVPRSKLISRLNRCRHCVAEELSMPTTPSSVRIIAYALSSTSYPQC